MNRKKLLKRYRFVCALIALFLVAGTVTPQVHTKKDEKTQGQSVMAEGSGGQ